MKKYLLSFMILLLIPLATATDYNETDGWDFFFYEQNLLFTIMGFNGEITLKANTSDLNINNSVKVEGDLNVTGNTTTDCVISPDGTTTLCFNALEGYWEVNNDIYIKAGQISSGSGSISLVSTSLTNVKNIGAKNISVNAIKSSVVTSDGQEYIYMDENTIRFFLEDVLSVEYSPYLFPTDIGYYWYNVNNDNYNFIVDTENLDNTFVVNGSTDTVQIGGYITKSGNSINSTAELDKRYYTQTQIDNGSIIRENRTNEGNIVTSENVTAGNIHATTTFYTGSGFSHIGDPNTFANFLPDEMAYYTGGVDMLHFKYVGPFKSVVVNEGGADVYFRVESDKEANMFYVSGTTNTTGIGTSSPSYPLEINRMDSSGISLYLLGNGSADEWLTRTSVYDKSKGSALNYIKDSNDYLVNGKIDHSKFYGYAGTTTKADYSRPVEVEYCTEDYCEMVTEYPYKVTEEQVSLNREVDMLRQAVYELEQRIIELEQAKGVGSMADNQYYCSTNPTRTETCVCLSTTKKTCYYETCGSSPYGICTGGIWIET